MEKNVFDEIAGEWEEYRPRPSPVLSLFLKNLKKEWTVLDLGCGNGRNLVEIASRCKFAFGIDNSKKMLECASKKVKERKLEKKVNLVEADALSVPLTGESVDAVFALAVLHHLDAVEKRRKAFGEISRVLKPRGLLFISVWNGLQKKFESAGKDAFIEWKTKDGKTVERFYHFFNEEELKTLASAAGFEITDCFFEKSGKNELDKSAAQNLCLVAKKP